MESKIFNLNKGFRMTNDFDLLTEREAAHLLRLSQKTLQRRRVDRKPPTYLCLNGSIRYRLGDLKAYLENSIVEPQHNQETSHVHE